MWQARTAETTHSAIPGHFRQLLATRSGGCGCRPRRYTTVPWRASASSDPGRRAAGCRARISTPALRDLGTFEGQRKRAALINGAAVELAASVPGILFAKAYLDQDQFNAALNYGRLHAIVFGRVWLNLSPLKRHLPWQSGPVPDEETVTSVRQRLDKLNDRMTLEQRLAVANVPVFNMLPTWFFAARGICRLLQEDEREHEALLSGLTVLTGRLVGGR